MRWGLLQVLPKTAKLLGESHVARSLGEEPSSSNRYYNLAAGEVVHRGLLRDTGAPEYALGRIQRRRGIRIAAWRAERKYDGIFPTLVEFDPFH
jgi:hypothetical protein